jgi:hypothetical protein
MKTAVEWLIDELSMGGYFPYGPPEMLIKAAKEMDKTNIIVAHLNGCEIGEMFNNENREFINDSLKYYDKIYKQ